MQSPLYMGALSSLDSVPASPKPLLHITWSDGMSHLSPIYQGAGPWPDDHHNNPTTRNLVEASLPYPGSTTSVNPPLHTLVTFRFTSLNPTILDCTVVGPNNETYYRVVTDVSGQAFTLLKTAAGHNIALVEWRSHPTVEAQGVTTKQPVGQWLPLSSDRCSRTMIYDGVHYSWAPLDRFLHLFAPGSSEWLARVTRSYDAVVLELTPRAIELGLIDAAILATALLQCGKNID